MKTVTVTTAETVLEELELIQERNRVAVQVKNVGSTTLNSFNVKFRATRENDYVTFLSQGSDWTSPVGNSFLRATATDGGNSDPTTLAAGEEILFYLEHVAAFHSMEITASVTSGSTDLEISIGTGLD